MRSRLVTPKRFACMLVRVVYVGKESKLGGAGLDGSPNSSNMNN